MFYYTCKLLCLVSHQRLADSERRKCHLHDPAMQIIPENQPTAPASPSLIGGVPSALSNIHQTRHRTGTQFANTDLHLYRLWHTSAGLSTASEKRENVATPNFEICRDLGRKICISTHPKLSSQTNRVFSERRMLRLRSPYVTSTSHTWEVGTQS